MAKLKLGHAIGRSVQQGIVFVLSAIANSRGKANGLASLDETGRLPNEQLPKNMEIDSSLTIHGVDDKGDRTGYKASIHNSGSGVNTFELPSKSGTLAMTEDLPTKTSQLTNDSRFVQLDENGKVPASQLPAFLDDIREIAITWEIPGVAIYAIKDKDGNSITINDLEQDVIYVNTTEDDYANALYRWTGTKLVPCPNSPKTEDLTVTFIESDIVSTSPDNITSGSTMGTLFTTISKAIGVLRYLYGDFRDVRSDYLDHANNTSKHVNGIDPDPTPNSTKVVTSGGVYAALNTQKTSIDKSIAAIQSDVDGINQGVGNMANSLGAHVNNTDAHVPGVDTELTEDSTNFVTSGLMYTERKALREGLAYVQSGVTNIGNRLTPIENKLNSLTDTSLEYIDSTELETTVQSYLDSI